MEVKNIAPNKNEMMEVEDSRHEIEEIEINMNVEINGEKTRGEEN